MQRGLVIDAAVAAIVLFAAVRGWRNGTLREGTGLLALFAGLAIAPALAGPVGAAIETFSNMRVNMARLIGLIVVIALIELLVIFLVRRKTRDVELGGPRWLDRAGGVVVALFRGITIAVLFLYALLAISATDPELPGFTEGVMTSASGGVLADGGAPVPSFYDGIIARTDDMRGLTLSVRQQTGFRDSERSDRVSFAPADRAVRPAPSSEEELLELVNRERAAAGLEPLQWCDRCAEVARSHSRDMYEQGYFSHVDVEGVDPFERMQAARIGYASAGENLAIAPTAAEAHQGLMASSDHRENILRGTFDEVGIGVFEGPYGLMCTQVFRETL